MGINGVDRFSLKGARCPSAIVISAMVLLNNCATAGDADASLRAVFTMKARNSWIWRWWNVLRIPAAPALAGVAPGRPCGAGLARGVLGRKQLWRRDLLEVIEVNFWDAVVHGHAVPLATWILEEVPQIRIPKLTIAVILNKLAD